MCLRASESVYALAVNTLHCTNGLKFNPGQSVDVEPETHLRSPAGILSSHEFTSAQLAVVLLLNNRLSSGLYTPDQDKLD